VAPIAACRHQGADPRIRPPFARALAGIGPARAVNGPQVADQIGGPAGKIR
jgi:hypothetical protein